MALTPFRYERQVGHECARHALNNLRACTWVSCTQQDGVDGEVVDGEVVLDTIWDDPTVAGMHVRGVPMVALRPQLAEGADVGYTLETVNLALKLAGCSTRQMQPPSTPDGWAALAGRHGCIVHNQAAGGHFTALLQLPGCGRFRHIDSLGGRGRLARVDDLQSPEALGSFMNQEATKWRQQRRSRHNMGYYLAVLQVESAPWDLDGHVPDIESVTVETAAADKTVAAEGKATAPQPTSPSCCGIWRG